MSCILMFFCFSGENQYRVPKGTEGTEDTDRLQDAEKRLSITELPDMLCLTLKRFTFDASTSTMTKVRDCLYLRYDGSYLFLYNILLKYYIVGLIQESR